MKRSGDLAVKTDPSVLTLPSFPSPSLSLSASVSRETALKEHTSVHLAVERFRGELLTLVYACVPNSTLFSI